MTTQEMEKADALFAQLEFWLLMLLAKIGGFACTYPTLARSSPGAHGDVFMCEQMVFSTFLRLSPRKCNS